MIGIGIDLGGALNEILNNRLLNSKDPVNTGASMKLVKFANKYGMFGIDAIMFAMDLLTTLSEIQKEEEMNE